MMHSDWKNKALFLLITLIAFVDGMLVMSHLEDSSPVITAKEVRALNDPFTSKTTGTLSEKSVEVVAKSVPFTTQAPTGYWTKKPWSDYAEEAAVYMAYKWGVLDEMPNRQTVAENLRAIGEWETTEYGSSALTDIPQTLRMLTNALGYTKAALTTDISESTFKALLNQGALLLVPVNGQTLNSPYYGDPAPQYHMLLIFDHRDGNFIVNDPGTSRGEGIAYSIEKVLNSLGDLDGEKRAIVVTR